MNIWLSIRSFIALFFVLFGLAFMFGHVDEPAILGAFFASLGLTFFLSLWLAVRTGK